MVTTLVEGVTIHSAAVGSIVQSVTLENKKEEATVLGMVSGKTQIVKTFDHSEMNVFDVTGQGDLTMLTGVGVAHSISLLTGGITMVGSFKYEQALKTPSKWSYSGNHYPYGS